VDLRRAQNKEYQQLAEHADVKAIVSLLFNGKNARGPIALFLRDHASKHHPHLSRMFFGLGLRLSQKLPKEQAQTIVATLEKFYYDAMTDEDLNRKRGMLLEMLVRSYLKPRYAVQECMMQCHAYERGKSRRRINTEEVDVCAWSDDEEMGEAYECKTNPFFLTAEDCDNLVGLADACEPFAQAFRLGAVSFEVKDEVEYRLEGLEADLRIRSIGWNNWDDLHDDPITASKRERP
jgi:hypothetical protein